MSSDVFPRLQGTVRAEGGTLSGGEQQMLAIGRGMMAEPELLILDEPSIGLSPLLVEEMFDLIDRLKSEGLTILLVEQNVLQSMEIADRAFVMENGDIRLSGKPSVLMDDPELQRSYLGLA
jgi:branched-chain amino acid transport system ATP-binding protein